MWLVKSGPSYDVGRQKRRAGHGDELLKRYNNGKSAAPSSLKRRNSGADRFFVMRNLALLVRVRPPGEILSGPVPGKSRSLREAKYKYNGGEGVGDRHPVHPCWDILSLQQLRFQTPGVAASG